MEMKTFNNWQEYLASKDSTECLGILLGNGTHSENPFVEFPSASGNPFIEYEITKPLVNKYFKQDMDSFCIGALMTATKLISEKCPEWQPGMSLWPTDGTVENYAAEPLEKYSPISRFNMVHPHQIDHYFPRAIVYEGFDRMRNSFVDCFDQIRKTQATQEKSRAYLKKNRRGKYEKPKNESSASQLLLSLTKKVK